MKKKALAITLCLSMALGIFANTPLTKANAATGLVEQVTEGYNDIHVIPDKLNTGCDESTCTIPAAGGVISEGPDFRVDNGTDIYIDFNSGTNKTLEGTYTIENVDFTGFTGVSGGVGNAWGYTGAGVTIRYVNCKFANYRDTNEEYETIKFEFVNCSFKRFRGMNSTFDNCYFGGGSTIGDPVNPYANCTFNNCYVSDIVMQTAEQGNDHMDGMQTAGAKNLYFNNCRFEVPDINYTIKNGGMSYAVYIQPAETVTAENVVLDHCYINGGGLYSISVISTCDPANNIRIIEPFIGYCYTSNTPYYPTSGNRAEEVTENPRLHDSLYVSSVWKGDDGKLHFLVTNDTEVDRTLSVYTNEGLTEFEIPRTYKASEYEADTKDFDDLPIDIEKEIAVDAEYAVFYDGDTQIRFVNYSTGSVFRNTEGEFMVLQVASEGDMEINFTMASSEVNITVPLNVLCSIDPNEEDGFVHGDAVITNNSTLPLEVYVQNFSVLSGDYTMLTADGLPGVDITADWEELTSEESSKYMAIGVGAGEDGWLSSTNGNYTWANNVSERFELGVIAPAENATLTFDAKYGRSLKETSELQLRVLFVAEISD